MTKYLRKISTPSKVGSTQVIDSLNSTSKTDALSADAGRILNEKINNIEIKSQLLDLVYPIGSIYISYKDISPASLFGGTWTQIKDTFLLACGDTYANGATGGEATHQLKVEEIPPHNHLATNSTTTYGPGTQDAWRCMSFPGTNHDYWQNIWTNNTGGGQPHNNMPPYLAVCIWKRVA